MRSLIAAFVLSLSLLVSGCATTATGAIERAAVQVATIKVVTHGEEAGWPARATTVKSLAEFARASLDGERVALPLLATSIRDQLDMAALDPADRVLAELLIHAVVAELESRVGDGVIPEDQRYQVALVLDWVITTAEMYR